MSECWEYYVYILVSKVTDKKLFDQDSFPGRGFGFFQSSVHWALGTPSIVIKQLKQKAKLSPFSTEVKNVRNFTSISLRHLTCA